MFKRKLFLTLGLFLSLITPSFANTKVPAKDVTVNTSGFVKNLSSADSDVQHALQTIDALSTSGSGDITDVGDCTSGACFTPSLPSKALTFKNITSGTITLQTTTGALGTNTISLPAETGTICTTGSTCSGYQSSLTTGNLTASSPLSFNNARTVIGGATNISVANAVADGSTKGVASFTAADFNDSSGNISLDYVNGQTASGTLKGFLSSADWTTFNNKGSGNGSVTSIATSNGITGGTITTTGTISGINAVSDGATKGVASFTAVDFNDSSGNISLDYTNGQKATTSLPGFLSSTDWTTFNNKVPTSRTITAGSGLTGGGDLSANRTISLSVPGSDTQVIYNNGGNLGGATGFTYNNSTNSVSVSSTASATPLTLNTALTTSGNLIDMNVSGIPFFSFGYSGITPFLQFATGLGLAIGEQDSSVGLLMDGPSNIIYFLGTLNLTSYPTCERLKTSGGTVLCDSTTVGTITAVGDVTSGGAFNGTAGNVLQFEGATADANEISLTGADPTIDYTVTIPAVTGTLITTGDVGSVTGTMIANDTVQLTTDTAGNYIATVATSVITGLTGGSPGTLSVEGQALSLNFDYSSTLSSQLAVNNSVFGNNGIIFEGSTADAFQGFLTPGNPTADRTWTIPDVTGTIVTTGDVGSVTGTMILDGSVALGTDTSGKYVSTITTSILTGLTGGSPGTVQNAGSTPTLSFDYSQSLGITLAANATVFGSNGILFGGATSNNRSTFLTPVDPTGSNTITIPNLSGTLITTGDTGTVTGTMIANDTVQLTTDTAGAYISTIATSTVSGLTGGSPTNGSEGAALTFGFDYSNTLAGNPGIAANGAIFGNNGIIFEGATANNFEMLLTPADPTTDVSLTLPAHTGYISTTGAANPTVSSCGVSPTVTSPSYDNVGHVTIGTGVVTACTITFAGPKTNAPGCNCSDESTVTVGCNAKPTTTTVILNSLTTFTANDVLSWNCQDIP